MSKKWSILKISELRLLVHSVRLIRFYFDYYTFYFDYLRWLKTVSSTFQEVDFDGSLLPLFIN